MLSEYLASHLDAAAIERLETFYRTLVDVNQQINLTRIVDAEDFALRHVRDSLVLLPYLPASGDVLDLGTGGGIPGLILWLVRPDLNYVLLDSVGKKLKALGRICEHLQATYPDLLPHTPQFIHGRAEDVAHDPQWRNHFPLVVSRAVASLPVLLELCLPFVKPQGRFIAMKGPRYSEEMDGCAQIAALLGAKYHEAETYTLGADRQHVLLHFNQQRPTPKGYPRAAGTPGREPLTGLR
jgi:16S rRNA (guanine527-N7)-methyltransferase